jgi:hypothetical protein
VVQCYRQQPSGFFLEEVHCLFLDSKKLRTSERSWPQFVTICSGGHGLDFRT